MKQYVVIYGDIVDGITIYGPYSDPEKAIDEWDGEAFLLVELWEPQS